MQSTTSYSPGDVLLVDFVYADERGSKRRPVVVISTEHFNRARREVVVAAITSNSGRQLPGDSRLEAWREAGLVKPSTATGHIKTVSKRLILRKLGVLVASDFNRVGTEIGTVLALR